MVDWKQCVIIVSYLQSPYYNSDGNMLLAEIYNRKLQNVFDLGGAYRYTKMLCDLLEGKNDSWAIRWHASAFLKNMFTLYPARSLVYQIGFDGTGTHCADSQIIQQKSLGMDIKISKIPNFTRLC